MARYRHKDETDLAFNRIRRRITAEVDLAVRDVREVILNDSLSKAWEEFTTAVGEGKLPEVEARYEKFVTEIVADRIPQIKESVSIDGMD